MGSQFWPRGIKMSRKALWVCANIVEICLDTSAATEIYYQNSCRSCFSGMHLAFKVFQEGLGECKEMLGTFLSRFTGVNLVPLRAQRLKKFKILKFSSEIENFKRGAHQTPIFCGEL